MKKIVIVASAMLAGCVVQPPPRVVYVQTPPSNYQAPPPNYQAPPPNYPPPAAMDYQAAPEPVVSVYVDPPLYQPPPIRVDWAPPPMLVENVAPMPYAGAFWIGGFWVWEGNWVWAHGRWAPPPQPGYGWVNPYYENRGGSVVFVNGFWAAPGVSFVAPPMGINIAVGVVAAGVVAGPRPIGPQGVFVPPPPGSRRGLIVPAPVGTAPAVVTGAPPIVREGMRVNGNVNGANNVRGGPNVTIVAPASATANGQAVNSAVPAQPHLAAAVPPVVKSFAPEPVSAKPIPAYVPGRQPIALPAPQAVHATPPAAPSEPRAQQDRMNRAAQPMPGVNNPPPATPPKPANLPKPANPPKPPSEKKPKEEGKPGEKKE